MLCVHMWPEVTVVLSCEQRHDIEHVHVLTWTAVVVNGELPLSAGALAPRVCRHESPAGEAVARAVTVTARQQLRARPRR